MANSKVLCTLICIFLALNGVNSLPPEAEDDTIYRAFFRELNAVLRTFWEEMNFFTSQIEDNPDIKIAELESKWDNSYGSFYPENIPVMTTLIKNVKAMEKYLREYRMKFEYIAKKSSENPDSKIIELFETQV